MTRWLDAWRERWQEAELTSSKRHYGNCRISIAYRVISDRNREQFARLLQETTLDVMFFTDFVETGVSRFDDVGSEDPPDSGFRQFPVLEKALCVISGGGHNASACCHRRFAGLLCTWN